ncbi:phage portal protein, partial [bacterium]
REIEEILLAVISANGGAGFFQDMAVLGSVYGFVDCVLRPSLGGSASVPVGSSDAALLPAGQSGRGSSFASILRLASSLGLELIEAPRALPVLDENDYRRIRYYLQHFAQQKNQVRAEGRFLSRLLNGFTSSGTDRRESVAVTEVIGPRWWQRYEDKELIAEGPNILSEVPVVHIQNLAQPYFYEGLSDVEQLIPLQDELNTRLSDRASRITLQTFRMYLAKGLDDFTDQPIGPGQMWSASNPDATIEAFGGDTPAPGEDKHIAEIREAMDKVSGVTPVVAGVLKNKLGNLTSGVALKMTFMGMLAKTVRKQHTYGEGIKEIGRMVLRLLDVCGVYPTEEQDRELKVIFPNPLPTDEMDRLEEARIKIELGVPREKVLQELGY